MSSIIPTDDCLNRWAHRVLADADDVTARKMFGCPAFFVGRRMFACVYQSSFALKLPANQVASLVATEAAHDFQPYGKPKMRQWCALAGEDCNTPDSETLLLKALTWARLGHPTHDQREVSAS